MSLNLHETVTASDTNRQTVLPVGRPGQKTSLVARKNAYTSNSRDLEQKGNGYWWESWGKEEEEKEGTNW